MGRGNLGSFRGRISPPEASPVQPRLSPILARGAEPCDPAYRFIWTAIYRDSGRPPHRHAQRGARARTGVDHSPLRARYTRRTSVLSRSLSATAIAQLLV